MKRLSLNLLDAEAAYYAWVAWEQEESREKHARRLRTRNKRRRIQAKLKELETYLGSRHCAAITQRGSPCKRTRRLQVDHVNGRDWTPRDLEYECRLNKYLAEAKSGVPLRWLCTHHNAVDGNDRKYGRGKYAA